MPTTRIRLGQQRRSAAAHSLFSTHATRALLVSVVFTSLLTGLLSVLHDRQACQRFKPTCWRAIWVTYGTMLAAPGYTCRTQTGPACSSKPHSSTPDSGYGACRKLEMPALSSRSRRREDLRWWCLQPGSRTCRLGDGHRRRLLRLRRLRRRPMINVRCVLRRDGVLR